jgi:phosphate transport system substrate-binding protein
LLAAEGVAATTANVAAGRFPIGRPLNLVTAGAPGELARAFIDYCRSGDVHDIVTDLYFTPLGTGE